MSDMEFKINSQDFFRELKVELERGMKVRLDSLSGNAKECASIFNKNNDDVLDKNELWAFLDVFHKADMGGGDTNGRLSDNEIDVSLNNYNAKFKKYDIKQKKQMLVEVYSKVLAQEIKAQIDGPSINQRTKNILKKIDANNILEVLKEYNSISPNETLASAIDNEWGLDIKTVKKYICEPLVERAIQDGVTNIESYDNINDINKLNSYIKKLVKQIKEAHLNPLDKEIRVQKKVNGRNVNFTYNRASIEDHVINHATDKHGKKLTYFTRIPAIRKKSSANRTSEENKLLNEFNNYITYVCKAGEDYGVDPKRILAITQQEVGCKGLNHLADGKKNNVTGGNGKGYMQVTSVCIVDVLGGQGDSLDEAVFNSNIKSKSYNKDFEKLLISEGFNPKCPISQRKAEAKKIWNKLIKNDDPEFNIRFGTLWLRYQLEKANDNFKTAAVNYNGSSTKYQYADSVSKFFNQLVTNQRKFKH